MLVDYKLLNFLNQDNLKPTILKLIIRRDDGYVEVKEIVILDRSFNFWLLETEIEVFLDIDDVFKGYKLLSRYDQGLSKYELFSKLYDHYYFPENKENWKDDMYFTHLELLDIISSSTTEYSLWTLFGQIFYLNKSEIKELVVYDLDDFKDLDLKMDVISVKKKEGIRTTWDTMYKLKKRIHKNYNLDLFFRYYVVARVLEHVDKKEKEIKKRK